MARLEIWTDWPSLWAQSIQGIQVANYEHLLSDSRLGTYDRYEILETYASLRSLFLQLREENPQSPERTLFNRSWAAIIISEAYQHIRNHSSNNIVALPNEEEDNDNTWGDPTDRDGDIGAILHEMLIREGLLSAQEDIEPIVKTRKRRIKPATKTIPGLIQQTQVQTTNIIRTWNAFAWLPTREASGLDFKTRQLPPWDRY